MGYYLDAPRCQHLRDSGIRCGSPALRDQPFCYNHQLLRTPQLTPGQNGYRLPVLESRSSIQHLVRNVLQSFHDGHLNAAQARVYLYGVQLLAPYSCSDSVSASEVVTELTPAMEKSGIMSSSALDAFSGPNPDSELKTAAADPEPPAEPSILPAQSSVPEIRDHQDDHEDDLAETEHPPLSSSPTLPPSAGDSSPLDAPSSAPAKPPQSVLLSPEEREQVVAILHQPGHPDRRKAFERLSAHNRALQRR